MHLRNTPRARRGSILIVVIGLLALFAVVGLSFVLYADAEATAARSARAARNDDALPNPDIAANDFLRQLILDTNDTSSALRGHGLITSRYEPGSNVPFTGTGIPAGTTSINYTGTAAAPINKAVPWTYPDLNNYYLAWLDPATGEVKVPSFHRSGVFASLAPNSADMTDPNGYLKTLRPHPSKHPNFPKVPANPDGSYSGDLCNLHFMTGSQKNDSLWMYAGSPVQTWRGRQYVAMVAPLILDLSGRVNLSVAGNRMLTGTHGSTHGLGQWEINATLVLPPGAAAQTDLANLIAARFNGTNPPLEKSSNSNYGLINRGRNSSNPNEYRTPPFYSLLDVDSSANGSPPMLPQPNGTVPFPDYSPQATYPSGFDGSSTMNQALQNHPSTWNPLQWTRDKANGAHGFGMDDLVKMATRYNDPKNRYQSSEIHQKASGGSFSDPTNGARTRHLTTAFSVSQRWGRLPVNGGAAYVGPVDLNRPLPDYRDPAKVVNPNEPLSSTNIVAAAQLSAVDTARQKLAMDIFVRLLAASNLVDGANIVYAANTGAVTVNLAALAAATQTTVKQLAQFAVNIVDYIDGDDIMTGFLWHDNTDIVWGTELPKLVLNEAYSALFNDDADSPPPLAGVVPNQKRPAQKAAKKSFWVELHNPLKSDATLPDSSAARLFDTNGNINCYEIVIGEDAGPNATNYSTYLQQAPENAATDPAAGGITIKIRVNQFNMGTANATLNPAERYLVQPTDGATAIANGNKGYYVIGPPDRNTNPAATTFPDKQDAALTYSFVPTGGQNSMQYDAVTGIPSDANINTEKAKKHTVLLRRLANPYVATAAGSNPYVTVDVVEGVPTHDRIEFNDMDRRQNAPMDPEGTIGKRHPYATGVFTPGGAGQQALALQTAAGGATPPHTFFLQNSNLDNVNNGLAWLAHLDRELVNATEILQTSIYSPALLTKQFFNSNAVAPATNYNNHYRTPAGTTGNLLDINFLANGYKLFDILTVSSRLPGIPLGGREPGLMNLNTMNDDKLWAALTDVPQVGNTFNYTAFAQPAWTSLSTGPNGRTITPNSPSLGDKPFQPGTSLATTSMEQTLLRTNGTGTPVMFNQTPMNGNHDYFKSEPLRKIMNNTTTVTDGFLVIWTVGFFEVEKVDVNGKAEQIGKELYERIPGDMRSQFAAVVDRSMVTVDESVPVKLGPKPWESKLTENVTAGSNTITMQGTAGGVYIDGELKTVPGRIRIGLGDAATGTGDGEWVTASAIAPSGTPGQVNVTITPTAYYHGAGSRVSNGLLGAPLPAQVTNFNSSDPANRHIVPYYIRMQP